MAAQTQDIGSGLFVRVVAPGDPLDGKLIELTADETGALKLAGTLTLSPAVQVQNSGGDPIEPATSADIGQVRDAVQGWPRCLLASLSDTVDEAAPAPIYVLSAGDVKVNDASGNTFVITIPATAIPYKTPFLVSRVWATGTTVGAGNVRIFN